MTTDPAHTSIIDAFLADGGYLTVEDWARDSDFQYNETSGEWYSLDDLGPWAAPVDIYGAIEGAIESSGFEAPRGACILSEADILSGRDEDCDLHDHEEA